MIGLIAPAEAKGPPITIGVRRRPLFLYLVEHNPEILSCMLSNTNLILVASQHIAYYITMYATKHSREEAEAAQKVLNTMKYRLARLTAKATVPIVNLAAPSLSASGISSSSAAAAAAASDAAAPAGPITIELDPARVFRVGAGELIASALSFTSTDTIPSQAAAFYSLGGCAFRCSHVASNIPIAQGRAFIEQKPIHVRVTRNGAFDAAVLAYVYRPNTDEFKTMTWVQFARSYEIVRGNKYNRTKRRNQTVGGDTDEYGDVSDGDSADPELDFDSIRTGETVSDDEPEIRNRSQSGSSSAASGSDRKKSGSERTGAKRGPKPVELIPFLSGHPRAATHALARRTRDAIVTVGGPRLRCESKLNEPLRSHANPSELLEHRDEFAAQMLLMFIPWRSMDEINPQSANTSYWEVYLQCRDSLLQNDVDANLYLRNSQSYYTTHGGYKNAAETEPPKDMHVRLYHSILTACKSDGA